MKKLTVLYVVLVAITAALVINVVVADFSRSKEKLAVTAQDKNMEFIEMQNRSKNFEAEADSLQKEVSYACSLSLAYLDLSQKQANASVRKYLEQKSDSLSFAIMLMASDRDFLYSLARFTKP